MFKIFKFLGSKFSKVKKTNMENEIFEQSDIVFDLIRKYIKKDYSIDINIPENFTKVALIASGSSYHSASIAAFYIRTYTHYDASSYYASEVALSSDFIADDETLYIFISQSGETSDTNIALNNIKTKSEKTLAITNTKNSTLYNNSNYKILLHAGIEKSIASTKAVCAQIFCLFLLIVKIMQRNNISTKVLVDELLTIPEYIRNSYNRISELEKFSSILSNYENVAILASGSLYPLAKESALKIKETSYINATAYPTGEFLHGHIAILNKKCAVIVLVNNQNSEFTINVLDKIKKDYKIDSIVISAMDNINLDTSFSISIKTSSDIEFLFSSLVILQLLAFKTAVFTGRNVDTPTGLTKIVR